MQGGTSRPGNDSRAPGARPAGFDVALAVARERLSEAQFVQALAFIDFTREELAAPRALGIFARLHHLGEEEYRTLKNRVLASYGAPPAGPTAAPAGTFVAINGDIEWDVTASLFNRIRRRMGGRRNLRLRRRVELFSGRVEGALLAVHVDSVCRMATCFDGDTSIAFVLRTYMEALGVRRAAQHAIYIAVLERLFRDVEANIRPERTDAAVPQAPPETRPLKMVPAARSGAKAS